MGLNGWYFVAQHRDTTPVLSRTLPPQWMQLSAAVGTLTVTWAPRGACEVRKDKWTHEEKMNKCRQISFFFFKAVDKWTTTYISYKYNIDQHCTSIQHVCVTMCVDRTMYTILKVQYHWEHLEIILCHPKQVHWHGISTYFYSGFLWTSGIRNASPVPARNPSRGTLSFPCNLTSRGSLQKPHRQVGFTRFQSENQTHLVVNALGDARDARQSEMMKWP